MTDEKCKTCKFKVSRRDFDTIQRCTVIVNLCKNNLCYNYSCERARTSGKCGENAVLWKSKTAISLNTHFKKMMVEGIKESLWFKSAPKEYSDYAEFVFIGVEERMYGGLMTTPVLRPCFVAECTIGDEKNQFTMLLDCSNIVERVGLK